jgi:putative membrane protein
MRGPMIVAGAALLSVSVAMGQATPGGGMPGSVGQQTTPGSQPGMSTMDQAISNNNSNDTQKMLDKAFAEKALQGGMAEVELGHLALQKSSNAEVKEFAQKMVDDHTKMDEQMKQVTKQMNVKTSEKPSSKEKSTISKLQALNGDAFDKAYIKEMVKDHRQDQKEFSQEASNTGNPALRDVVGHGEQIIAQHLQMIEQIAQKNNVASK